MSQEVFILGGKRMPMGEYVGALKDISAINLSATGTRLVLTLLRELQRRRGRYGLATACIGGGQGIAMIVERV